MNHPVCASPMLLTSVSGRTCGHKSNFEFQVRCAQLRLVGNFGYVDELSTIQFVTLVYLAERNRL